MRPSVCVLTVFLACGAEAPRSEEPVRPGRLAARVDPAVVGKGRPVAVTCVAQSASGRHLGLEVTEFIVAPDPGGERSGMTFVPGRAGAYEIRCVAPRGAPPMVVRPVALTVTEADLARVETRLEPAAVTAGESLRVGCTAVDTLGERIPLGQGFSVTPGPLGTRDASTLRPTQAGEFRVACHAPPGIPVVPADLTVRPGPVERTRAAVATSADVPAGTPVAVSCAGYDGFENRVALAPVLSALPPEGAGVAGGQAVMRRAGAVALRCEAAGAAVREPAWVHVVPGPPARFTLRVSPERDVYAPGEQVALEYDVRDAFGNPVEDAAVDVTLSDPDAARRAGRVLTLLRTGDLTVTARLGALEGSVVLRTDGTPPDVLVAHPPQGGLLDGEGPVAIDGWVGDPIAGVRRLEIDGAAVTIGPGGRFVHPVVPRHGLNLVRFRATDARGNVTTSVRAFHWARAYRPGAPNAAARISDGVVARLEQSIFDDLGLVLALVLGDLDLSGFLPDPLVRGGDDLAACACDGTRTCTGWTAHASMPTFEEPFVELMLRPGGLSVTLAVTGFQVALAARGKSACAEIGPLHGNALASMVTLQADLDLALADGRPRVAVANTVVDIEGLALNLDLGPLGPMAAPPTAALERSLEDALVAQLERSVPAAIEGFLGSFGLERPMGLPAPLAGSITLGAGFSSLAFSEGAGLLGLGTGFVAEAQVPAPGPGSVATPTPAAPAPPAGKPLALALHVDAVNQLFYAAWKASGLVANVTALVPPVEGLAISSLTVKAALPPLLALVPGAEHALELAVGGLKVALVVRGPDGAPIEIEGWVHGVVAAGLSATGNRIALSIGGVRDVAIELTRVPSFTGVQLAELDRALEEAVPRLATQLASSVLREFELPALDLRQLGLEGVPAGVSLGLDDLSIGFGPSHLYVAGALRAR